jgi:hypothetical protein
MSVVASEAYAHEERMKVVWGVRYFVSRRLLAKADEVGLERIYD